MSEFRIVEQFPMSAMRGIRYFYNIGNNTVRVSNLREEKITNRPEYI